VRGSKDVVVVAREKIMSLQKSLGYESYRVEDESYHHVATVDDAWMLLEYEVFPDYFQDTLRRLS
jgi:hypothetical protein